MDLDGSGKTHRGSSAPSCVAAAYLWQHHGGISGAARIRASLGAYRGDAALSVHLYAVTAGK